MSKFYYPVLAALCLLVSCSSDKVEDDNIIRKESEFLMVEMTFSPYDQEPLTRAAVSIADVVTHLDVWIYESGTEVTAVHQASGDALFGSMSLTLDKTKTYTIYACGHRATAAASLANGIITFPNDKVVEAMYYTTTFSPSTTTSLSCLMQRIVGKFILESTDALPDYADHIRLTIGNTATRYGVGGTLENVINREVNFTSLSSRQDGTILMSTNILSTTGGATFDILLQVFDADNNERQSRLFQNVPIRNNYRTTYRGIVFRNVNIDDMVFTVNDWQDLDVVDF